MVNPEFWLPCDQALPRRPPATCACCSKSAEFSRCGRRQRGRWQGDRRCSDVTGGPSRAPQYSCRAGFRRSSSGSNTAIEENVEEVLAVFARTAASPQVQVVSLET